MRVPGWLMAPRSVWPEHAGHKKPKVARRVLEGACRARGADASVDRYRAGATSGGLARRQGACVSGRVGCVTTKRGSSYHPNGGPNRGRCGPSGWWLAGAAGAGGDRRRRCAGQARAGPQCFSRCGETAGAVRRASVSRRWPGRRAGQGGHWFRDRADRDARCAQVRCGATKVWTKTSARMSTARRASVR